MNKLSKIKIKSFKKNSGLLIPLNFNRNFPISVKRIFFIYGKLNMYRGDHAHKKCVQAFFSVKGSFFIECIFFNGKKRKILIKPGKNLQIIQPFTWVKVNLRKNDVCGVLCDRYYEEDDYY